MLERQLPIVSMLFLDHKYGTYATQMTSQCVLSKPPLRSGRAPSAVGKSLFPAPAKPLPSSIEAILYFPEKGCHLGTNRSDNET